MGKYTRGRKRRGGKPSGFGGIVTTVTLILLAVLLGAAIFGILYYNAFLNKIPRVEHTEYTMSQEEISAMLNGADTGEEEPAASDASPVMQTIPASVPEGGWEDVLNVLLIGQSAREGETYHTADTMILVSINKVTGTVTLTSFLRDTYLRLPDYQDLTGQIHALGNRRLNECYHLGYSIGGTAGAMEMLNTCLFENFGVEVDFNIEIGFEGVEKVVDYFGGIEVELTQEEADYLNADDLYVLYDVQPGPQILNGTAALSYARMRNAEGDGGSDIKRTSRQRILLEKLLEEISDMGVLELQWMLEDVLPYIVTDMTNEDITRCILEIFPLVPELKLEAGTCPAEGTYWAEAVNMGGYDSVVLQFDREENRKRMESLSQGN